MLLGIDDPVNWHPNPKFSSPENTWAYYKKMLLACELEDALARHNPHSAGKYRETYGALGSEKVKEIVREMTEIEKVEMDEEQAEYQLLREINGQAISFGVYLDNIFGE